MSILTRRKFLIASGATAAAAGLVGGPKYVFAAPGTPNIGDTIVLIHLRGGADGMMIMGPAGRADYDQMRGGSRIQNGIAVPQGGGTLNGFSLTAAADAWTALLPNTAFFPAAGVVEASIPAGTKSNLKSHFDAEKYTANGNGTLNSSGWMGRMVEAQGAAAMGAISKGKDYLTGTETVNIDDLEKVTVDAYSGFNDAAQAPVAITGLNNGADSISKTGDALVKSNVALADLDVNELRASYPNSSFGRDMAEVATVLAANIGPAAVQVDVGGWDMHGNINGQFNNKFSEIADACAQLAADTNGLTEVTVIVTTEFGRTMRINGGGGTDHGRARCDIVMGEKIIGGVYGGYPAALDDDLPGLDRNALPVMTDVRDIYTEVMTGAADVPNAASIFNNFTPAPALNFIA